MTNVQGLQAQANNFFAWVVTEIAKLAGNNNLGAGFSAVAFIAILLLIMYLLKSKQVNKERQIKNKIALLILHLCDAYAQVEEWNFDNKTASVYSVADEVVEVNQRKITGPGELLQDMYPEDAEKYSEEKLRLIFERVMKTCTQEEIIVRVKNEKGSYEWMSYLLQGVKRDNQHHRNCLVMKHSVDNVKSKELERGEQMQRAMTTAKKSAEAKGRFMSRLSRELKTPLDAIISYLALAGEEDNKAKADEYIAKSDERAKHLRDVISDVLDIAAIENGDIKIETVLFDFEENLHSVGDIFSKEAKRNNIGFDIQVKDLSMRYVEGDKLRLNQILINILNNAFKFTQPGGQVNCLVKQKELKNKKVYMEFAITDTGKGIPQEYLKKIFLPFEETQSGDKAKLSTGLGLAITNNLVHILGGVINVASEEGKGSSFNLIIPFEYSAEHNRNMEEIQTFPFVKALVVDDQENSCKYLEALLKKFSVETKITTGGQQAIQILSEAYAANKPFNLCLLDWKMPGMDGLTVAKKIKELNLKGLKVILVTSSDFNSITEEREELGITAMVNKPLFTATIFSILMENFSEEVAALNSSQPKFDFKGARVLVAEHNEITSELVVKLLEKVNFKVDKVTDGKDACEKFGTAEPRYYDAIIVDLDLPEIDGTEVAKIIRMSDHAEGQTIPIIALVDNVLSEDAAKAISCGMNSYVEKPIDKDKLYNTLSNLLR